MIDPAAGHRSGHGIAVLAIVCSAQLILAVDITIILVADVQIEAAVALRRVAPARRVHSPSGPRLAARHPEYQLADDVELDLERSAADEDRRDRQVLLACLAARTV